MTRPDWCDEATWERASILIGGALIHDDSHEWIRRTVAEAIMLARAEQREEDARIAETADRPGRNTGSLIAAAIRNGGK